MLSIYPCMTSETRDPGILDPLNLKSRKVGTWDKKSKSNNFFEIRLILFLVKNNLRKYQFYLFMINSLFVFNFKSLKINVLSFFVNAIVNSVPWFRFGFSSLAAPANAKSIESVRVLCQNNLISRLDCNDILRLLVWQHQ